MNPRGSILNELLGACKRLARDRAFSSGAVLIFSLCLAANVALFAVVNAILVRDLPYPQPKRLVLVENAYPKAGVDHANSSVVHYLERRAGVRAFADMGAYQDNGETIGDRGATDRVDTMRVTPSFLRVLGIQPALGRNFSDEEGYYGKDRVVILSDALWRSLYAASPDAIGKQIRLGVDRNATIIGVMPANFRFGTAEPRLLTPLCFSDGDKKPDSRHSGNIRTIARLAEGANIDQAQAQVDALNAAAIASDPLAALVSGTGFYTRVTDLKQSFVGDSRSMLLVLQGGVLCLMLIGAVNLANLLLVRAISRTKDLQLRRVLGAGNGEITRHVLCEILMLSLTGWALGLAFGWAGLRLLDLLGASALPHTGDFDLSTTVCLASLALSLLVGTALAVPVLWHSLRGNLAHALSVESRGGTTTRGTQRLRLGLIVLQFGLAFMLLNAATLLALSFEKITRVNPGFKPSQLVSGRVSLPYGGYREDSARQDFARRLAQELARIPGIESSCIATAVPFSRSQNRNGVVVDGKMPEEGKSLRSHYTVSVLGDFFGTSGIRLREGRLLNASDELNEDRVCVIDADVARAYWPQGDALGHRLSNGPDKNPRQAYTIVGVVDAVKQQDLADVQAQGTVYMPFRHFPQLQFYMLVRSQLGSQTLTDALRSSVRRVDPELPVTDIKGMETRIADSLSMRRAPLVLTGILSGLALLLAAVGLFSVMSYTVLQHQREIGIRMALGALPSSIRRHFLAQATGLAGAGLALGLAGSLLCGPLLSSLLFGVSPSAPHVIALTGTVLTLVALTACLIPAHAASKIQPMDAMRGT